MRKWRRRKWTPGVPVFKRPCRRAEVDLMYLVDGDDVELYVRYRGLRLIVLRGHYDEVAGKLIELTDSFYWVVKPLLLSTEQRQALLEAENIVRGSG